MSSRFVQLLLLPLEQQPQPTHTLKKGVYVPMDKPSSAHGRLGLQPSAENLETALSERFDGCRVLLVLDDVWMAEQVDAFKLNVVDTPRHARKTAPLSPKIVQTCITEATQPRQCI